MATAEQTITIDFRMADPDGAAALRVAAGHAMRVGEAWSEVGERMMDLAKSLERLTHADDGNSGDSGHHG